MQKIFLGITASAAVLLLLFLGKEVKSFFCSDDAEKLMRLAVPHSTGFADDSADEEASLSPSGKQKEKML